jgi:hypothetical protein
MRVNPQLSRQMGLENGIGMGNFIEMGMNQRLFGRMELESGWYRDGYIPPNFKN